EKVTVGLTMAGALTPAGLGGAVISLMEAGFVDWIIATGANLYHDLHFALNLPLFRGDFRIDDVDLHEQGVVRIYDVLFSEDVLLNTDRFVREALQEWKDKGGISSAELHNYLGHKLLKLPHGEHSILATAAKLDIPIYTSSPGDSSIGMNLARLALEGGSLHVDPNQDVNETTALVYGAEKNGAILLGGGSPKNFYMQTQPQLWEVLGINKGGHDYFIQVTADAPHWGGLSGATPSEAVSWGKINPEELNQTVVVYADTTIAFPIIVSYALDKAAARPQKRLYRKREELLSRLKEEFLEGKK
ncbi:MAG TPA: deoxyhypusine synthase, partial [Chroococcales cyanobacterium]